MRLLWWKSALQELLSVQYYVIFSLLRGHVNECIISKINCLVDILNTFLSTEFTVLSLSKFKLLTHLFIFVIDSLYHARYVVSSLIYIFQPLRFTLTHSAVLVVACYTPCDKIA